MIKTEFSMRANSVIREPEIQNFWVNNNIDFELGSNNQEDIYFARWPTLCKWSASYGSCLNKVLKDIINKYKP